MASTYPLDVAEAAEWSKTNPDQEGDAAVEAIEDKPWDPSVKSLVAFPPVLAMMNEKPDWVQNLGDAFLADPDKAMDRVQYLRTKAKEAGNLESTEQQKVSMQDPEDVDDAEEVAGTATPAAAASASEPTTVIVQQAPAQVIVIEPAQPEVVYVPTYNPTVIYGTWWWPMFRPWYWRPVGYGYGAVATGIAFGVGIGVRYALWGGVRWGYGGHNDVNINVNRYNNINVNNPIKSGDRNANWKHDPDRRRGTPYGDSASREKYGRESQRAGSRDDARGRDASRARAQDTLTQRGADPAAGRDQLRNDPQTRERAQATANTDRGGAHGGPQVVDRGGTRSTGQSADRSQARASAQNAERSSARQTAPSRSGDSAFKGSGNAARTQQSSSRGSASRSSASSHGGSFGGGGGGMRGGGGGGRRR